MLGNYFKPNSKTVLKISLAMKGFIGSISAAAFFDGNKNAAFWFLVGGAFIDFLIQCMDNNGKGTSGKGAAVIIGVLMFSCLSCNLPKHINSSSIQDSTWTNYKPVDIKVTGAAVVSGFNLDSVVMAIRSRLPVTGQQGNTNIDSLLNAAVSAMLEELKELPPKVVTDPESKVQLKYWYDQYGKLNMECSSKDQTIQMLVAEINKLTKERRVETVVKEVQVWYTWCFLGWAVFATVFAVLLSFIRK